MSNPTTVTVLVWASLPEEVDIYLIPDIDDTDFAILLRSHGQYINATDPEEVVQGAQAVNILLSAPGSFDGDLGYVEEAGLSVDDVGRWRDLKVDASDISKALALYEGAVLFKAAVCCGFYL
jgi:hypothetical protein